MSEYKVSEDNFIDFKQDLMAEINRKIENLLNIQPWYNINKKKKLRAEINKNYREFIEWRDTRVREQLEKQNSK